QVILRMRRHEICPGDQPGRADKHSGNRVDCGNGVLPVRILREVKELRRGGLNRDGLQCALLFLRRSTFREYLHRSVARRDVWHLEINLIGVNAKNRRLLSTHLDADSSKLSWNLSVHQVIRPSLTRCSRIGEICPEYSGDRVDGQALDSGRTQPR